MSTFTWRKYNEKIHSWQDAQQSIKKLPIWELSVWLCHVNSRIGSHVKRESSTRYHVTWHEKTLVLREFFHGCGSRTRTGDLQVMGLASCQLLYPAIVTNVWRLYGNEAFSSIHQKPLLRISPTSSADFATSPDPPHADVTRHHSLNAPTPVST